MSTNIMPLPKVDVAIRPAVLSDLAFIDGLQKIHTKQVGWMPTKQLEGKIASGNVLVAEEVGGRQKAVGGEGIDLPTAYCLPPTSLGYCIAHDQYFKRDDVGIIYQMNVVPGRQRGLIGATLLKAQFERSAWGCKLYCCWCAQDIGANKFWEAMGFVPLAFRTGSAARGKNGGARTHIFWQKRIRQGDTSTPYWFPSQTSAGSIREDRLVLPIPPGVHWCDVMPSVLPGDVNPKSARGELVEPKQIGSTKSETKKEKPKAAVPRMQTLSAAAFCWETPDAKPTKGKKAKTPRIKQKNDPTLVAAARELRDRWLEQVNAGQYTIESAGKYDVAKMLVSDARTVAIKTKRLTRPARQLAA